MFDIRKGIICMKKIFLFYNYDSEKTADVVTFGIVKLYESYFILFSTQIC